MNLLMKIKSRCILCCWQIRVIIGKSHKLFAFKRRNSPYSVILNNKK